MLLLRIINRVLALKSICLRDRHGLLLLEIGNCIISLIILLIKLIV